MSFDLSGKVAFVSGASRGLGAAIAEILARCGAHVAVNTYASRDKAEALVQGIRKNGGSACVVAGDVRSADEIARMVDETTKTLGGPIDIMVANATGPQPFISIEELTWTDFENQLDFFIKSPLLLMQAVVGSMKARRYGRFINIGSEVFERGVPEFSQYCAAKGAQLGLTRSWANELAPWGITVNLVAPGWIPTERHQDDPQALKDAYASAVPMKRMGVPEDVGAAVAFLASDQANFITGQKLSVNGGNTLA